MFDKIKDWLGIEGVKIDITTCQYTLTPQPIAKGTVRITTLRAQYIEHLTVTVKESYTHGWRSNKKSQELVLGKSKLPIQQEIAAEETITTDFNCPFQIAQSKIDKLGNKGWLYKGISKLAKLSKNVQSQYVVLVELKVQGNKLKPFDQTIPELQKE